MIPELFPSFPVAFPVVFTRRSEVACRIAASLRMKPAPAAAKPARLREGRGEITVCVFCGHVDDPAAGLYKVGGRQGGAGGVVV